MRYFVDVEEMSLLDLIELKAQVNSGVLEADNQGYACLCAYIESRDQITRELERARELESPPLNRDLPNSD